MNGLRELVVILSTFLWIGGAMWMMFAIIAADPTVAGPDPYDGGLGVAPYLFAGGLAVSVLVALLWRQRKEP